MSELRPEMDALSIAKAIGDIVEIRGIEPIQTLRPKTITESSPSHYSGNFGLEEFPLHTDLAHWQFPPRYIFLRCARPAPEVATHLIRSDEFVHLIGDRICHRAMFRPRKRVNGRLIILRMIQKADNQWLLRWDRIFLVPENEDARELWRRFDSEGPKFPKIEVRFAMAGDTLIIDNWVMLHGRSAIPASARSRIIERSYLKEMR